MLIRTKWRRLVICGMFLFIAYQKLRYITNRERGSDINETVSDTTDAMYNTEPNETVVDYEKERRVPVCDNTPPDLDLCSMGQPSYDHLEFEDRMDLLHGNVPVLSSPRLPRILSTSQYKSLMYLLSAVLHQLNKYSVPHMMWAGTLLGSYMMHDLLPWDDDIDLIISNTHAHLMLKICETESFQCTRVNEWTWKAFRGEALVRRNLTWGWPFIDLVLYNGDDGAYFSITEKGPTFKISKRLVFPLHLRPFASFLIPAPKNTRLFLRMKYGHFSCRSHWWNHVNETMARVLSHVPCKKLLNYYPQIQRSKDCKNNDTTTETLLIGSTPFYSICVRESLNSIWVNFEGPYQL